MQILIESAPWIGYVPSNVYAVKKPARVEMIPPAQNYKRVAVDTQVYNHKKPDVAAPVNNHMIAEENNGRNVLNPQRNIVQNGLDSQNNVHKVQKASDSELKFQKLPDSAQKLPESGLKSQERAAKVQSLPENGLNVHKLPDEGVKLQSSPDSLLKNHKSEVPAENGPMIQHSQDIVFKNQNYPRREEKRVEPVAATVAAAEVLDEEEHPLSLKSKDKELITPTSWTG